MGILNDLKKFGLGEYKNIEVFEEVSAKTEKTEKLSVSHEKREEKKEIDMSTFLFKKQMTCPVCDGNFTTPQLKVGKTRAIKSEVDLRAVYRPVDSYLYDFTSCPHCGYSALKSSFHAVYGYQKKEILTQITPKFKPNVNLYEKLIYTYDDAITLAQLALVSTVVKKAKTSERAYTALKLAWLYRGAKEQSGDTQQQKKYEVEEEKYLNIAYQGFYEAISKETFPICNMDEPTLLYLTAALGYETNNHEYSLRLLSEVITSSMASSKLKDKALDLKDMIVNSKQ